MARGFLAEIQYQARQAEKRNQQAIRRQASAQSAQARDSERARKAEEQAHKQAAASASADRKALEKDIARLKLEARTAEVESLNADLDAVYEEVDSMLVATLEVDDFVDLEDLRASPTRYRFVRPDLETPEDIPGALPVRPQPVFAPPPAPSGLSGKLGGAGRHAKAMAQAQEAFAVDHQAWQAEQQLANHQWQELHAAWQQREAARIAQVEEARLKHEAELDRREREASAQNSELDSLIQGLAAHDAQAVQTYIGIVLANSVYPEEFPVDHEYEFGDDLGELDLLVKVPSPDTIPSTKAYKYVKSKDEISETSLPKTALKERYSNAVAQVAVRSMHEVFEADRQGIIKTISLAVAVETRNPATGLDETVYLASCAAERESFLAFDLTNVEPAATLTHLNGQLSKNAFELVPIDMSRGVRG